MSHDTREEGVEFSDEMWQLIDAAFGGAVESLKDGVMPAYAFFVEGNQTAMMQPPGDTPGEMLEAMKLWLGEHPDVSRLVIISAGEGVDSTETCLWALCFERGHAKGWLIGQQIRKGMLSRLFKPVGEIFYQAECETIFAA